jgi:hypothetical protein
MKRAPWFLFTGVLAGFAGVLGLHGRPASASIPLGTGHGIGGQSSAGGSSSSSAPVLSGPARSASGSVEQYGYGELAVKVTAQGSRITDISVPLLRTADPYSQQLAQQVIPMLRSQVLKAQSARIYGVSGATYTAEAYDLSLQKALDKLHIK